MNKPNECDCSLSDGDIRAALIEMKSYVDVTEEDLKKIYEIALRHARERLRMRIAVRDVMTKSVITVKHNAELHEAARLLSENKISGMPVVDELNKVVGVISEADLLVLAGMEKEHSFRDILKSIMGEPISRRKTGDRVQDVMSVPPLTIKADDDVQKAAQLFDERRIKRLPVVDDEGKLAGIISRADIVRTIGRK